MWFFDTPGTPGGGSIVERMFFESKQPLWYWVLPCSCSCPKSSIITICDQQMDPANQVRSLNITPLTLLSFCFTWIPLAVISVPRSSNNWPLCHVLRKLVKATQRQKGIPLSIYDVVSFPYWFMGSARFSAKPVWENGKITWADILVTTIHILKFQAKQEKTCWQ